MIKYIVDLFLRSFNRSPARNGRSKPLPYNKYINNYQLSKRVRTKPAHN